MTVSRAPRGAGRKMLAPSIPSTGLVAVVWLFMLVFPLLFLLVWVNRWLDDEYRWRELAAKREMLDVMRELQPRLAPAKRLEDGLSRIEAGLGFPNGRNGRSWKAAQNFTGLNPAQLSVTLRSECRRIIGCEPVFLLTAGADGRSPDVSIDRSLLDGVPPRATTMQPVWLSVSGWMDRGVWRKDAETEKLRRRWSGPAAAAELRTRKLGLFKRLFGEDPFLRNSWGAAHVFLRMRPGGGVYLAYANFLPSEPKPEAPLLGGYIAVFRIADIPKRFFLEPLLSRPDGGISRRLVVVPRESRLRNRLQLECAPPTELLQDWCTGRNIRPFSLMLRRSRESVEHPFRSWQPWLRAAFYLTLFGSGFFILLNLGGFLLPLRLRGQITFAVGIATVLPLLACTGVMVSYLEYRQEIDRDRQGKMVAERLEMFESGLIGHLDAMKQRLWQMNQLLSHQIGSAPDRVPKLLERIRKSAASPAVLLITQNGTEHFVFSPEISAKTRAMAERLSETPRTISMRMFLMSGCFKEADLDTPPRSSLWTRRRRAIASNMGLMDITAMMAVDGREIDPKFSGITDSIFFQYMVKSPHQNAGKLQGLLYVMYRRSDIIRTYFESLERRNEVFSGQADEMSIDYASFATSGDERQSLDRAIVWPRAAAVDTHMLGLAHRALLIPGGSTLELPQPNGGIAFVRAFSGFPAVAVGCARAIAPDWKDWENRGLIAGWCVYAMLLVAFVTYFLAKNFAWPLERLSAAGREVAAGRFDVALHLPTGDEFERLATEFNAMTAGLREREHLARFVSDEVLATVHGNDAAGLNPGGERRHVGILFAHIVDFDRLTSHASVDEAFRLLDDLLPRMERAIRSNGGSLDKVIGDGVMGVFYPGESPVAVRAGGAALAVKDIIAEANRARGINGDEPMRVSVGFVTGNAVCGRIGSRAGRLDFTVIGDTVNLAARLEAESRRRSDSPILLDEETVSSTGAAFRCISLGTITVKGRIKPVQIFELMASEARE